ncbi:DUF2285 domain-containing protein [Sphingopyxis indica]|uniref:DNA -binding domain-containing protein n=1 Tax=Sphingopyxis indica TaxID=436663 RepID=UPI00293921EB|nr:DUF2285 domain-containing protein [Sphingopyxis indica]MEA3390353.1 DUF2285 domain-containing protein [Pseudomonadota bacterium]WOF43350.1 DUF2285 domain-containing protein [Sphingopyxis indica]
MAIPDFDDRPPQSSRVTRYDERHFVTYLRMLEADEEGAHWLEIVRIIFDLDPVREPQRAWGVYESHLARARWMTEIGYLDLLQGRPR